MNFIALSVPVFFILIGVELVYGIYKKQKLYRLNDSITNLSCGIGQQVLGAWFKVIFMLLYIFIYEHSIYKIPENGWTWLLCFIGVDFCYYWFHRLSHEINAIWATHIVHHQSEEYNLSVALRQSWFQTLFSSLFYIPLAWLGFSPLMIVTVSAFNTLYQFWIHTKAIKKLPAPIEFIFNTPSHHRVHHGSNPKYIDKNHAGTLIIWDRLFGTFQKEEEEVVYGITTPLKSWNPVWANFHYWKDLFVLASKAPTLQEKILVFLAPPGWKPQTLGGREIPKDVNAQTFQKFDITTPRWIQTYALIQFVFIIALTSYFMFFADAMFIPGNEQLVFRYIYIAGYILFSIYNLGKLFENRTIGIYLEIIRNLINAFLIWLFVEEPWFIYIAYGAGIFTICTLIFLVIRLIKQPLILKQPYFETA
ncbi:MAG: sterol desaturase family protein [Flavobacteriales bacterium]|nr:sterol desaturase family protein [Flavobacteriales bacterium]